MNVFLSKVAFNPRGEEVDHRARIIAEIEFDLKW
jgi:hypothetical protein